MNIDYKIHYVDRETDLLVLSFSHMDFNAEVQPYWGRGALEKLGLSFLGITAKANDWYPDSFLDLPIFSFPLRHKFRVTARLLPGRFRFDAGDEFFIIDKAVEEVVPFLG